MGIRYEEAADRQKKIVRASIVGIATNLALVAFKAAVGLLSRSIAIVMDAVNNLSDALSSVITIVGARFAMREPDKKHPFGYGRIEYLSSLIIAILVLYAGVTSLVESIKKIITPETPDYTPVTLIIVAVAVVVKIVLGLYVRRTGRIVNSDSLVNSGKDALMDAILSAATLAAALVYVFAGVSLEAYLAAVISVIIIKAGFEMFSETVSKILGEPGDVELLIAIKRTITEFPEVHGAYDLILHNYGPDTYTGSVHIELEDTCSITRLDELTREIAGEVFRQHNVIMTAIGIYSVNTRDEDVIRMKEEITAKVLSHEHAKQIHGFYYNAKDNAVWCDVVVSFDAKSRNAVLEEVLQDLRQSYPDTIFMLAMDMDYGEICAVK
ncbi:MAG: cation transporter [Lachnospiraceae bacterium]|nr:cation transporter [Lachnospiraceae bacterium]